MSNQQHAAPSPMVPASWKVGRYLRPTSFVGLARDGLRLALGVLLDAQNRQRQQHALANLDPRLLEDVGLTSGDVLRETGRLPNHSR